MYVTNYGQRYSKVKNTREKYPAGARIVITRHDGKEIGSGDGFATVIFVDDLGTIKAVKDNGTVTRIIPGLDAFRFLTDAEREAEEEREIIRAENGKSNGKT